MLTLQWKKQQGLFIKKNNINNLRGANIAPCWGGILTNNENNDDKQYKQYQRMVSTGI